MRNAPVKGGFETLLVMVNDYWPLNIFSLEREYSEYYTIQASNQGGNRAISPLKF